MKGSLSVDRSVIWFGFVTMYFQRYLERSDGVLFNAFLVIIIMIDDADDDIGDVDDERGNGVHSQILFAETESSSLSLVLISFLIDGEKGFVDFCGSAIYFCTLFCSPHSPK